MHLASAAIIIGGIWIGGDRGENEPKTWAGLGACLLLIGLIGLLVAVGKGSYRKNGRGSKSGGGGLVIAPSGFALQQDDLRGQMRWDEITDLTFNQKAHRIVVKFPGSTITIKDIFNVSLRQIFRELCTYWKGPPPTPEWAAD